MQLDRPGPLTEEAAAKTLKTWIDRRIEKPTGKYTWSQMRWLVYELGLLCVKESLAQHEDEEALWQRLSDCYDIVHSVWYEGAPEIATREWRGDEEPTQEEQEAIELAKHTLWTRHDPLQAFEHGWESKHYININLDELISFISDYLARPWLRHPTLDWILLDMLVTQELCAFGEALKERFLPGKRDPLLGIHNRYLKARGNLDEMKKPDWNAGVERLNLWFWWVLGFPTGAIFLSFYFGYHTLGWWLLGVYLLLICVSLAFKLIDLAVRLVKRLSGLSDPKVEAFKLWDEMYEVWKRLERPVVNPMLVRNGMRKSSEHGAVWSNASWSLIDRAIAFDPAVWIVEFRSR